MKNSLFLLLVFFSIHSMAQTNTIELHPNNRVASYLMSATDYNSFKTNSTYRASELKVISQGIYQKFQDDFDFIFFVLNEDNIPSGLAYGYHTTISNDISGIGRSIYDYTAQYGSSGKLKGILTLTRRDLILNGPSLHELMHKWGNFSLKTDVTYDGITYYYNDSHWGFTGGTTKGQLGGFQQSTLVDKGGNNYSVAPFYGNANGGNVVPYSKFELYLMGMIPITEVPNFDVFNGVSNYISTTNPHTFTATKRTTYTPASLQALLGNRVPSSVNSQKDFKALIVVLTASPLTTTQWNVVDGHAEKFGRPSSDGTNKYNFWEATNGKGTLETGNLQNSLLGVVGISETESEDLNDGFLITPNPATNDLTIINQKQIDIKELTLYNSMGLKVGDFSADINQEDIHMDVSGYSPGIYFLRIFGIDNFVSVKRVIIN